MRFIGIVLLALTAGCLYGIVHDQVTARICVEYFTIGHPPLFHTQSPTLLAICWGIAATWWVALPLGFSLACAARLGSRPKKEWRDLLRPLGVLLGAMAATAALAGITGWMLATFELLPPDRWVIANIPVDAQIPFTADAWAHSASYLSGFVGAAVLCVWVWRSRSRIAFGSIR